MGEKKWLSFVDTSEVNLPPKIEVSKSSKRLVTHDMRDAGDRTTVTVR